MIYAVCPFSRPEFLDNVIQNFSQQTFRDRRFIVVENGEAVGACEAAGFKPDVLLQSDNHQSHAKNAALEWICVNGGGWFATFDDDDYYGPRYLEEVMSAAGEAEIVGKNDHFLQGLDGRVRFFETGHQNTLHTEAHGATLCARAEDCPRFADTGVIGEDFDWLIRYQKQGAKLRLTSPFHYMIVRHPKNTWQVQDASYLRRMEVGSQRRCKMYDYGERTDSVLAAVNRVAEAPRERIFAEGELQLEDSPAMVAMMENARPLEEVANEIFSRLR